MNMILENGEKLLRFSDVPKLPWLPPRRNGSKLEERTVHRWASEGRRGVFLESVSAGAASCTSEAALRRFFQAISDAKSGHTEKTRPATPAQRSRAIAQARQELKAHGI